MKTTNFNTVDSSPKFINSGMRKHIYKYEKGSDFNLPKLKQMNNNNQAQKLKCLGFPNSSSSTKPTSAN